MTAAERREDGFTLIELMTVMVILGVLAAIALPFLLNHKEKASRAAAMSDLRSIRTAQMAFVAEDGSTGYTADVADLEAVGYNRSDFIDETVIALQGEEYLACVKHRSVDEWLVLESQTQAMTWSSTNDCA